MTTHRSLNKLEFNAHMSIHNKVEVPEDKKHGSNYTRDRFGKNHDVTGADGIPRLRRKKILMALALVPLSFVPLPALHAGAHNTDVQLESSDMNEALLNKKLNPPEEEFSFYKEGETSLGINEDGDPNMKVRF